MKTFRLININIPGHKITDFFVNRNDITSDMLNSYIKIFIHMNEFVLKNINNKRNLYCSNILSEKDTFVNYIKFLK